MSFTVEKEAIQSSTTSSKVSDYASFIKLRLASLVVFSAVLGYMLAVPSIDWTVLSILCVGGFLVTGSSNGFNQIIERDLDKLMDRTKDRPLAAGRMSVTEAFIVASLTGIVGVGMLFYLNTLTGVLGVLALFSYVAIYTPLKRITPWAVFVGAFPGAIPPMLGWVAATGTFGLEAGILFALQFMWQFPHFWAIAWKINDDYLKAGFKLLPSPEGRDQLSAFLILLYTLFMIASSFLPILFGMAGLGAAVVIGIAGILMLVPAINLYRKNAMKSATKLMFASFVYIPLVLFALYFDKL
ncbi:heme o synthase [Acidiluteibacter ferrifornacis]|uniref:Protoheme IX farnesyltransferase n=1 Tax=Acidiluteibacter ferrifornacis TaxID=2692424 RepID=A0A6N9NHV1_9FLAO|nr:heme o synthase [Acidiluteibacter ferrifornacis]NBG64777.1 protoheme IX farnesyltransferase [Acidiluteibacter ferrifornacis]